MDHWLRKVLRMSLPCAFYVAASKCCHYLDELIGGKQGQASRKTRTGIAFWSVNNYKHCVGSLSENEEVVEAKDVCSFC